MRILITGSTGMIGKSLLLTSLQDPEVLEVITLVRQPSGIEHNKLTEIVHSNLFDLTNLNESLTHLDAAFYCLGISAAGMSEKDYTKITYDLTLSIANELINLNPRIRVCYVSGAGTDSTGQGRSMWARVKGKTENDLIDLHKSNAFMFRPGYIQPMAGVKSRTGWYNIMYMIFAPLFPLMKLFFGKRLLTSKELSNAMLQTVSTGYEKQILEIADIKSLASKK